ncbi:uncharacterized protein LOC106645393 [Copidosoma floridanum]|uniref:uncharacterized protein LOC106645393 n=1 Tax=Copidosoma floridanum TaxID=29053 RepID=UPI0006C9D1B4|nr:uncharacterized protein LOC106645393 [Copidosoma floridanum]
MTDPKKLEVARNYPKPRNIKKVKQFLGFVGYYRQFVKNYAQIAEPLLRLLKAGTAFKWGDQKEQALKTLVDTLCSGPVLIAPDLEKSFIVTTDASDYTIGVILSQEEIGKYKPCE